MINAACRVDGAIRALLPALLPWLVCGCFGHRYERWIPEPEYLNRLFSVVDADLATASLRSLSEELRGRLGDGVEWRAVPVEDRRDKFHKVVWKKGPFDIFQRLKIKGIARQVEAGDWRREEVLTAHENAWKLRAMYEAEHAAIDRVKGNAWSKRVGLALSGGGIRSASFAVGVLQALHEIGVLRDMGYVSTVSGGGYAASWYMMHPRRDAEGRRPADAELFAPGSLHLQHLAQNGHYLVSAHFSKGATNIAAQLLAHAAWIPLHWLANFVFDLDQNVPRFREVYRRGIERTFQYDQPCASFPRRYRMEDSSGEARSPAMADFPPERTRPLWIVNMHLALNDDNTSQHRNRSGDAFELTPFRAGSDAVGYIEVPASGAPDWMTPSRAVAISGAAVDSESLRQGFLASLAIKTFNTDLGSYVPAWGYGWVDEDRFSRRLWTNVGYYATTFNPIRWSLELLSPFSADSPYHLGDRWHDRTQWAKRYLLTDGGHFENLGIYALVRRGCRLIVVSDAASDPGVNRWDELTPAERALTFADLRELEQKLLADFGAQIEMDWESFSLGPAPSLETDVSGLVILGHIRNLPILDPDQDIDPVVRIIYIKAAHDLGRGLRRSANFIDAEKADHPDFPNESTANQLYSERQVLAYRQYAREIVLSRRRLILESMEAVRERYGEE